MRIPFQKLLQPFTHILQVPGKQFLQQVFHAFNYWLKVPADIFTLVRDIVEMLHTASLL
jgi:geranylgeranyl diphosphate synthase type 3